MRCCFGEQSGQWHSLFLFQVSFWSLDDSLKYVFQWIKMYSLTIQHYKINKTTEPIRHCSTPVHYFRGSLQRGGPWHRAKTEIRQQSDRVFSTVTSQKCSWLKSWLVLFFGDSDACVGFLKLVFTKLFTKAVHVRLISHFRLNMNVG